MFFVHLRGPRRRRAAQASLEEARKALEAAHAEARGRGGVALQGGCGRGGVSERPCGFLLGEALACELAVGFVGLNTH